jgi:hypothetical protein
MHRGLENEKLSGEAKAAAVVSFNALIIVPNVPQDLGTTHLALYAV